MDTGMKTLLAATLMVFLAGCTDQGAATRAAGPPPLPSAVESSEREPVTSGSEPVAAAEEPIYPDRGRRTSRAHGSTRYEGLSKEEAVVVAAELGITFFYPGYWPPGLPAPEIRASLGKREETPCSERRLISIAAEKNLPESARAPGVREAPRRLLGIALYEADHVPINRRLRAAPPEGTPLGVDAVHGAVVTDRTVKIRVAGRDVLVHREGNMPAIRLGWEENDTYIWISSLYVPERELYRVVASLRPVRGRRHAARRWTPG
jgi:hypothetical protein